jgi:pimeloyl-ACP methyl ester carboxylesterase
LTDDVGAGTRCAVHGAVRIAYEDLGPPGGDPLLMLMGLGASPFWWPRGLIECLQQHGFRPAVLDLRDSGESTHVTGESTAGPYRTMLRGRRPAYRAEDLVDDAAAAAIPGAPGHPAGRRACAAAGRMAHCGRGDARACRQRRMIRSSFLPERTWRPDAP